MPPSAPPSPAPGTQPEGIRDERAAASHVREMFSRIAPRYDLLNHLLSLNLDKLWRRRTARRLAHILTRGDAQVLDLCCGTGDLALALADVAVLQRQGHTRDAAHAAGTHAATDPLSCHSERSEESAFRTEAGQSKSNGGAQSSTELHRGATIWGSDFAHPMLVRAREKASHHGIRFVEADALALPWPDTSFNLVTAAFGFRNLANYEAGLREIHRVLKPGGEVGILEFAAPRSRMIAALYRLYFTQILPRVGGAVSGSRAAYSYLPASVMKFPPPEELQAQMRAIGFSDPRTDLWTLGVVALHTASKP